MEVPIDGQGRITIPDYLQEFAHLQKQVVIAGLYDRLEIWDAGAWQQYTSQTEKENDHIAETLASLGV